MNTRRLAQAVGEIAHRMRYFSNWTLQVRHAGTKPDVKISVSATWKVDHVEHSESAEWDYDAIANHDADSIASIKREVDRMLHARSESGWAAEGGAR